MLYDKWLFLLPILFIFTQNKVLTMKTTLIAITLFVSSLSFSQKLHLGPELGMNLIKLDENKIGNNYQPSWHSGLAVEFEFTNWLSAKSGVFYTQKRQAFSSNDTSVFPLVNLIAEGGIEGIDFNTYSETEGRHTQNYLQIPLMASFNWKGLSLSLGGYLGYQFSSRTREMEITNTPFVTTIDIESFDQSGMISSFLPEPHTETFTESSNSTSLRTFDHGFKGAIGYKMKHVGVNLSYLMGSPDYRILQSNTDIQNHQYVQFSINYMLGIGTDGVVYYSRM